VWGKVGFSLGLVWGGRGVVCRGFLVLLVLNRTTYLKISKIRRWSEELWLRQHCSLSLKKILDFRELLLPFTVISSW